MCKTLQLKLTNKQIRQIIKEELNKDQTQLCLTAEGSKQDRRNSLKSRGQTRL